MTFDNFITKWNGKGIDFDGAYGDQCMDLMHQYIVEVLGQTDGSILAAPAAKDVYLNYPNTPGSQLFNKIDNTPTGVPQKGDIMFWGTGIGPYGHVAIFENGDTNSFTSFDQNWNAHQYCESVKHNNYTGVLGWLRFKGQPADQTAALQAELDKTRKERDNNWNLYSPFKDAGYDTIDKVKADVNNKQQTIDNLNKDKDTLNSQINTLNTTVLMLTDERDSAVAQAKSLEPVTSERDNLLKDKANWEKKEEGYLDQIKKLQQNNSDLATVSFQSFLKAIFTKIFK